MLCTVLVTPKYWTGQLGLQSYTQLPKNRSQRTYFQVDVLKIVLIKLLRVLKLFYVSVSGISKWDCLKPQFQYLVLVRADNTKMNGPVFCGGGDNRGGFL